MKPRIDFHEDFGITGLSKHIGLRLEFIDPADCLDLAVRVFDQKGGVAYALEALDDARRLGESALSDDELSTLWLAACKGRFAPPAQGPWGRDWLNSLAATCAAYAHRTDPSFAPHALTAVPQDELAAAVLAEVRLAGQALRDVAAADHYAGPLPRLVPSLETAVHKVGSDLAFRLFLRSMKALFVPIGLATLGRYEEIGRELGYHEWVVEDGNLNIDPDLDD